MSGVPLRRLGDYLQPVGKWNSDNSDPGRTFTYIDISAIDQQVKEIREPQVIPVAEAPSRARQIVRANDVLVSTVRPNLNAVASVPDYLDGVIASTGFTVLRPQAESLDYRYLHHWVRSKDFVAYLVSRATGASYPAVSDGIVKDARIPLPPLNEQRRIAAILDKADAIRGKRQQALALADDFLRSAFLEMFGDPRRNPRGLRTEKLERAAAILRGRFSPRPRNDPAYYGGDFPFIQTGDISKAYGYLTRWTQTLNEKGAKVSKAFSEGTVVVAIVGATIGETAILGQETYFPDSVIGISPRQGLLTSEFVEYALRFWKQAFRDLAPETARANINIETLRPIQFLVPPLAVQERFSKLYRCVHRELRDKWSSDGTLFASLSQRAFRGEL